MERLYVETKFQAGDDGAVEGMAWPYAQPDRIGDMITKGAFAGTALPLPMLFGHDQNDPIGVWDAAEDAEDGLKLKGRLLVDDLTRAREVRALVRSGAVRGISIGFRTRKAAPRKGGGRTISDLELLEASLVTLPMHPGARVTAAKTAVQAIRLAEELNRATLALTKG